MEGGWKTPPPRASSRAKSPGLIGLKIKLIVTRDIDGLGPPFFGPLLDLSKDVILALFWLTFICQTYVNI